MNILVTGGAGFIGSHLCDRLLQEGYNVWVVDNLSTGKKENINPGSRFKKVDIRENELESFFEEECFDAVFHLAAQMDVRRSVEEPLYDAAVNIMGGINLLENCARSGVNNFIFASSGGVIYGESPCERPDEGKYPDPLCPYGNSKLALEFYLNTYRHIHGLKTTALRFANVYGPRQDPFGEAGVVAIFAEAMLNKKEVNIFGNGNQIRDYVYVFDVVEALIKALRGPGGVYNIGTGKSKSVNDLFVEMKKVTGYDKDPVYMPARQGEIENSRMNADKALKVLGWQAQTCFEEGVNRTVSWFKEIIR